MKRRKPHKTRWRCCPNTRSCDKSESGWPLIAPKRLLPPRRRLLRYCAASRGPRNGMNGCLLDLFGQKLSWRARSESRLRCQIGWCQHFLSLAGCRVTFCSISFFIPLRGERSKVYLPPRELWQCQKSVRRIPVSCMQLKVTSGASPANQAQVASPNTTPAIAVR